MKTKTFCLTLSLILIFLMFASPAPAQATTPVNDLEITANLVVGLDGSSASGTFTIKSSLFSPDSGAAYETFFINEDDMTVHGVKTLNGANGTIVIKFQGTMTSEGVLGRFVVISGTGAYEKLHAVGDSTAIMDLSTMPPSILATYKGMVHLE